MKIKNDFGAIPAELKQLNKWVVFKVKEGRKVPVDPKASALGAWAKIGDKDTYGTFEEAVKAVEAKVGDVLGFAVEKEDGYIFMDIDYHVDKCASEEQKTKLIKDFEHCKKVAGLYDTYMEYSPSGEGAHLFAKGKLLDEYSRGASPIMPVELYDDKRFATFTGNRINDFGISGSAKTIGSLHLLQQGFFKKKQEQDELIGSKGELVPICIEEIYTDEEVLEVALKNNKFKLLWEDRWEEVMDEQGQQRYSTQHYADMALIKQLTFYTHNHSVQVERLFKQSPCFKAYGKGGKWSKLEKDIKYDIAQASSTCTSVYTKSTKQEEEPWQPNFKDIRYQIEEGDAISNPVLKTILLQYIGKYAYAKDVQYIPYLHAFDMNVIGFTEVVQKALGDKLIYSNKLAGFYLWNGKKYEAVSEDSLYHTITEVLSLVEHSVFYHVVTDVMEADNIEVVQEGIKKGSTGRTERDLLEDRVVELFQKAKTIITIKNCNDIMKKLKGMYVHTDLNDYYDTPYLNLQNGVLNMETKELLEHSTDYRLHKIMDCEYDPKATCPTFDKVLENCLPDAGIRKEILKALGMTLAKKQLPAKKALMIMQGPKDTGKTTLVNTIGGVLGDYGTSIDNGILMRSYVSKNNVGPEMLALRDTLFISTSEVSEDARLDAAKVKGLTGSTEISTRNLYDRSMILFKMIGIIFIDTNFKAGIPSNDSALWGRLRLFPFNSVITKKDDSLGEKLEAEKAGIFNRLLEGLAMVLEEGEIFEIGEMVEAKERYKEEMSVMEQFLSDCVVKHPEGETKSKIRTALLYTTYQNWCKDNNFHAVIRNKFYTEVGDYIVKVKSSSEYFIDCSFSDMGSLYSTMQEKSTQDFAKAKKLLLQSKEAELTYEMLKQTLYKRTSPWFEENIKVTVTKEVLYDRYEDYVEWSVRKHMLPIIKKDYITVVKYLYDAQVSGKEKEVLADVCKRLNLSIA